MDSSLTGSLVANILLAGVLGLAMKQIWALINTLQILTQIPQLNIQLPGNLLMSLQALSDVSNLNIIPKSTVAWLISSLTGSKAKAGASKGGILNNSGYLVIILGSSLLALAVIFR